MAKLKGASGSSRAEEGLSDELKLAVEDSAIGIVSRGPVTKDSVAQAVVEVCNKIPSADPNVIEPLLSLRANELVDAAAAPAPQADTTASVVGDLANDIGRLGKVWIESPKAFIIHFSNGLKKEVAAGVSFIEQEVANHWYSKANAVKVLEADPNAAAPATDAAPKA